MVTARMQLLQARSVNCLNFENGTASRKTRGACNYFQFTLKDNLKVRVGW